MIAIPNLAFTIIFVDIKSEISIKVSVKISKTINIFIWNAKWYWMLLSNCLPQINLSEVILWVFFLGNGSW